ncbi:zinc-binding dehydrogenase [Nocardia sp. NRRL S-836]|uniref:quinone oxidoreductase family protein n=1 Tax=Nocardia sp. NRRL S-836 TaxID=1519492 RepID=UPI0006B03499|nr:zinc-binding dehydrogenase [Nocardia sp. NRRL S-836]
MKAVVVQEFGGPEGLAVVDLPAPEPVPGTVVVTTEAAGVGGVDALVRSGALAAFGFATGHVLGGEVAGVVSAAGEGVDPAWLGKRVWGMTGAGGGYAEQALVAADLLVELPGETSAVDAVTLGGSGVVAHFALRQVHLAAGEAVLVRGAGGGLGVMAVQLAARAGAASITATTSSPDRGQRLRELGATHLLDRSGAGERPDGFDVVIDVVGGTGVPALLTWLNPNGRLVSIGAVGGMPEGDLGAVLYRHFQRSLSVSTFSADTVPAAAKGAVAAELFAATARGELTSVVHEVLPLAEASKAHRALAAGEVFGRVALVV